MSDETELIKERLDVAEVISEYVPLKQMGPHFKGLCPFHQEKTPSFVVSPDKGIWHCFGCGEGGDVFSFIQKKEGIEFKEALRQLADRAGVTLSERAPVQGGDTRSKLLAIQSLAARFYHEILVNHPAGEKARTYLRERGVTDESLVAFGVGFAPQKWDTFTSFAKQRGMGVQDLLASGLTGTSQRGTYYDRFRGRIMFPIHDVQGRVIAFGGRIVPWHATGNEGKYINSPETAIYEKRRAVYNLHRAKKVLRSNDPCVVVEGYMDVILLAQQGHEAVVATSGTAFTSGHVEQLARYTKTLHFAFDSDSAGIKAAQAATQEAVQAGLRVATVLFPAGRDPADVAHENPEELTGYLQSPTPLVDVLVQHVQRQESAQDRDQAVQALLPFIASMQNVVQQGETIQQLATFLHIPESVLLERVNQARQPTSDNTSPAAQEAQTAGQPSAEQLLLGLCIVSSEVRQLLAESTDISLRDQALGELLEALRALQAKESTDTPWKSEQIIDALPESLMAQAEALRIVAQEHLDRSGVVVRTEGQALLKVVRIHHLEDRLREAQARVSQATEDERQTALAEFQEIASELAAQR